MDLPILDEEVKKGGYLDIYIDNVIDTKIQPLQQMQPHVIIRPRPDVFEGIRLLFYSTTHTFVSLYHPFTFYCTKGLTILQLQNS